MAFFAHMVTILMTISFMAPCTYALAGTMYKWVDERGVTHFSDRQPDVPEGAKSSLLETSLQDVSNAEAGSPKIAMPPSVSPIEHATNCTFTIKGVRNLGTGFFISPNGYAITCRHVVDGDQGLTAVLNTQEELPLRLVSLSARHDLALVMVYTSGKTPYLTPRDLSSLTPGERVFAIGSSIGLQSTVTDGVFTGIRQKDPAEGRVVQFSAPINPGNSGGPLIDKDGGLIGVVSWKIISQKGIPVAGVGFAIPSGYLNEEYGIYMQ